MGKRSSKISGISSVLDSLKTKAPAVPAEKPVAVEAKTSLPIPTKENPLIVKDNKPVPRPIPRPPLPRPEDVREVVKVLGENGPVSALDSATLKGGAKQVG